jgi:hypothetical protein
VDLNCQSNLVVLLLCTKVAMALAIGHRLTDTCCQFHPVVVEAVVDLHPCIEFVVVVAVDDNGVVVSASLTVEGLVFALASEGY